MLKQNEDDLTKRHIDVSCTMYTSTSSEVFDHQTIIAFAEKLSASVAVKGARFASALIAKE